MKTGQTLSIGMMCAVMAMGAALYAQEARSTGKRQSVTLQEGQLTERQLKEKQAVEVTMGEKRVFAFVEPDGHHNPGDLVKGAPFSAQVSVENTQTLANGVHISNKSAGMVYRDSEGRTRSELPREGAPEIVLINDPIARVVYHLHMFQRTAVKMQYESFEGNHEMEERKTEMEKKHLAEGHSLEVHAEHGERVRVAVTEWQLKEDRELGRERKVESLGTQTVEGVQAVGTRVTLTFAAGREGNDQPFEIVSERWYSPELQMEVMTRRNDPRSGESIYRLTSINRNEPTRSLFDVPSDFALKEEKAEFHRK